MGGAEPGPAALGSHRLHKHTSQGSCSSQCWCGRSGWSGWSGWWDRRAGLPSHLGAPGMAQSSLACTQKLCSSGHPESRNSSCLLGSSPQHQVLSSAYPACNFRCTYLVCLISPWHFPCLPLSPTNGSDSCSPSVEFPGTREPASRSGLHRLGS